MTMVTTQTRYGVKLSVNITTQHGCCGVINMHGFSWNGDDSKLTPIKRGKLFRELMHNVLQLRSGRGIIVATDAVDGWGVGNAGNGGKHPTATMGFTQFLRYFKFKETDTAFNGNSGHGVRVFTKNIMDSDQNKIFSVDMPQFPKPRPARRRRAFGSTREQVIRVLEDFARQNS